VSFATFIGFLGPYEMERLRELAAKAHWRVLDERHDRLYSTAEVKDFWEPCKRSFFIRIGPGGLIHRHRDEAIKGITHHLVVQSNPKCLNWWQEDGQDCCIHLEAGCRYDVKRDPVHWATNEGETDRIHLLVEYG
jgi:hypothetical protein